MANSKIGMVFILVVAIALTFAIPLTAAADESQPSDLTLKNITVKPVDIIEESQGQTIKANQICVISGSLDYGHIFDISEVIFTGELDKPGQVYSYINGSIKIFDTKTGTDVTTGYAITTNPGILKLTEPFVVTTDPPKGEIIDGGGQMAGPVKSKKTSTSERTGSVNSEAANPVQDPYDSPENVTAIKNNQTPKTSGLNSVSGNGLPGTAEANINAGTALFIAIFAILAIMVICIINHFNKKVQKRGFFY